MRSAVTENYLTAKYVTMTSWWSNVTGDDRKTTLMNITLWSEEAQELPNWTERNLVRLLSAVMLIAFILYLLSSWVKVFAVKREN